MFATMRRRARLVGRGSQVGVLRQTIQQGGPRTVVVDDADRLDVEVAADLRGRINGRELVLVLVLTAEPALPAPLAALKTGAITVDVPLLTAGAVDTLLDDLLRGPVAAGTRRRFRDLAEGNPRYLEFLVEDAQARGQFEVGADGVLRLAAGFEPTASVLAAADDHLRRLSDAARSSLGALTLAGSLPVGPAGQVATPAVVAELEVALDLLTVVGDDHPDTPLVPTAWCLDAGVAPDPVRAHDAAMIASSRGDHGLAEDLLRVVRQGGRSGIDTDLALATVEVEGPGRTDRGLSRFAAIAANPGHEPAHRAAAAEGRAVALLTGYGDADGARRVARAAHLAYPGEVAGVRAGALAACLDVLLGDVEAGLEAAADLPDLGEPALARVVGSVRALARAVAGDLEGAAACLEPFAEEHQGLTGDGPECLLPPWATLARGVAATGLEVGRGRLPTARAQAVVARDRAERRGSGPLVAAWHAMTAHLSIIAGDLAAAEGSAIDAEWAAEPHDPWGIGAISRCQQALIAAQRGAVHLADELLGRLDACGFGVHRWLEVDRCRAMAWNEFAGGRSGSAAKLAAEAGELAFTFGRPLDAAIAFGDVVRFGHPDLAVPGAERAEAACPATLPRLLASLARGAATGDVAELRRVGDELLAAGLRSLAVEAWLGGAELIAPRRSEPSDTEVAEAADRLRRRAGAVLGPEWVLPITAVGVQAAVSSEREREVVALVAAGSSPRAVAELLGVAPRTVDNHVARALRRFGADDRDDLARLLGVTSPSRAPASRPAETVTFNGEVPAVAAAGPGPGHGSH